MVGYPGSGKSTIAQLVQEKGLLNNIYYEIINRDTLKTIQKCINDTITSIKSNYSIIIDNTNLFIIINITYISWNKITLSSIFFASRWSIITPLSKFILIIWYCTTWYCIELSFCIFNIKYIC